MNFVLGDLYFGPLVTLDFEPTHVYSKYEKGDVPVR